jgi:hypothetical protein
MKLSRGQISWILDHISRVYSCLIASSLSPRRCPEAPQDEKEPTDSYSGTQKMGSRASLSAFTDLERSSFLSTAETSLFLMRL